MNWFVGLSGPLISNFFFGANCSSKAEVTPFVSILRSVQMRKQQQHLLRASGGVNFLKAGLESRESRWQQVEVGWGWMCMLDV